jgi:lipopolysaccharide transport system ATP-binding protein
MPSPVITVTGLSKRYHIGARVRGGAGGLLRAVAGGPLERLRRFGRSSHREQDVIWALKDVSFEVGRGEVLGVIGPNGAGKSTLLKILSRITEPTAGRAVLSGRVGSLLEVGTGFHNELTGRENVYLSGAILGMRKAEIDARFDAIVDFSGLNRFLDTPVKRYSSGMRVRLGFAVAAHLEPEVLLVDEVLAVGDAAFQQKCMGKMESLEQGGRTILFVSHNMPSIKHLCSTALWLDNGQTVMAGEAGAVVDAYLAADVPSEARAQAGYAYEALVPEPRPEAWITKLELLDAEGHEVRAVHTGDPLRARIHFCCAEAGRYSIFFCIRTLDGCLVLAYAMEGTDAMQVACSEGAHWVDFRLPRLPLTAAGYGLGAGISIPGRRWLHKQERLARINVAPADLFGSGRPPQLRHGVLAVEHEWEVPSAQGIDEIRLQR